MIKLTYLAASIAGSAVIALGAIGVASAATNITHSNGGVSSSGIPRTVFKQEKLDAVAQVLNTTTANIQTARKNKTLPQLIASAGLSKQAFHQKTKAQFTIDLQARGYHQNQDVSSSGIPRTVFKQEKLDAVAQTLNTTTTNLQTARKNKTLPQLIASAGLSKQSFHQKTKAQFTSDLQAKGYSQSQVTIAMQQRTIARQRHTIARLRHHKH